MRIQSAPQITTPSYTSAAPKTGSSNANSLVTDHVSLQSSQEPGNRYGMGKVLTRAAGGAVNGLVCNWISGGHVGRAALIGAGVGGVFGGAAGFVGGLAVGGAAGNPAAGALLGAGVGGVVGAGSGAIEGAVTVALTNAFGGGPLAAAGVGAVLGIL